MKKSASAMMKMEMGTPKSPIKRRTCGDTMKNLHDPPSPQPRGVLSPPPLLEQAMVQPLDPCFAPGSGGSPTLPGRKELFLNWRRKKARKKVPAMSTRDSSAVLGSGTPGSTSACTLYTR